MKKKSFLAMLLLVSLLICSCGTKPGPDTPPDPTPPAPVCVHEYDDGCDETCNLCGEVRADAHRWVQIGDVGCIEKPTCQEGGLYLCMCRDCRKYGHAYRAENRIAHTYEGECAVNCSVCGMPRESTVPHSFGSDNVCTVCGHVAAGDECQHRFACECSTVCEKCGFVRTASHAYHQACSSDCLYCGETTRPDATHVDGNGDGDCDLCGLYLGVPIS